MINKSKQILNSCTHGLLSATSLVSPAGFTGSTIKNEHNCCTAFYVVGVLIKEKVCLWDQTASKEKFICEWT
jgi:hypothetical protein